MAGYGNLSTRGIFRQGDWRKPNLLVLLALLAVTLAGAWFRFYQIGKQPLWSDEALSVWMGRHNIADIIRLTIRLDQSPPLYYILLHLWMQIGGSGEAWVRSLSALFGIITILAIYFLAKTLSGPLAGLLAALALALSPFNVQFGQETRTYSLLALVACGSMWMAARLLADDCSHTHTIGQQFKTFFQTALPVGRGCPALPANQDRRFFQETKTDLIWCGYTVFTALAVYCHNTAIFLPVGINLFVFGLMIYRRSHPAKEGRLQAPSLRNWIAAQAGVFVLWSPWLPGFYTQATGVSGDFWIQPPTWNIVVVTLRNFVLADIPGQIGWQWLILAGFGGAFLLAAVKYRNTAGHFLFLALLFLTPFLGELLVSLRRPIFYDRTLIWCSLPLYVLIAVGISRLHFRAYIVTAVIIFVTLNGLSLINFFTYFEKERWDLASAYVSENLQKNDLIIFNSNWAEIPFDYYFKRSNTTVEEEGVPETMFDYGVLEPRMTENDLPRLRSMIQGRRRVWLVYSHNWWTDPKSLVPNAIKQEMRLIDIKNFNGMQIQLYEK